jgi:hypothetical protein
MFIALVLYGKPCFDDFWGTFLWKSFGSIWVKAV